MMRQNQATMRMGSLPSSQDQQMPAGSQPGESGMLTPEQQLQLVEQNPTLENGVPL